MRDVRGVKKPICANIDLYTGFIYSMLGIPQDMYTAIFAMARLAGWCAHRMEELYGSGRIIRPAYNSVMGDGNYVPMAQRKGFSPGKQKPRWRALTFRHLAHHRIAAPPPGRV